MYDNSKMFIRCPVCGAFVEMFQHTHYVCNCGWDSLENTVDIAYKDPESAALSNLFPHKFVFRSREFGNNVPVTCLSMESFLQSLRVNDWKLQKQICENYSGYIAWKLRFALNDWRKDGIVYWDDVPIKRESEKYKRLITAAYDCLFESNDVFRELVLPHFKGKYLIHSFGCAVESETLLTEEEYRYQLNRLMERV